VVKNTLAERAAKGTKVESGLKDLTGVTSIAYTSGDPVALAKALRSTSRDNPELAFKAGVVDGSRFPSRISMRWLPCRQRKRFTPSS